MSEKEKNCREEVLKSKTEEWAKGKQSKLVKLRKQQLCKVRKTVPHLQPDAEWGGEQREEALLPLFENSRRGNWESSSYESSPGLILLKKSDSSHVRMRNVKRESKFWAGSQESKSPSFLPVWIQGSLQNLLEPLFSHLTEVEWQYLPCLPPSGGHADVTVQSYGCERAFWVDQW